MKLTNTLRLAFVNAVIDDVPQVDYRELVQKRVDELTWAELPTKLKEVCSDPECRPYLRFAQSSPVYAGYYTVWSKYPHITNAISLKLEIDIEVLELIAADKEQNAKFEKLRDSLTGLANSCSTVKQLADRAPELAKYLPKEADPTKNLPVVSNVITSLMQAGWPKS